MGTTNMPQFLIKQDWMQRVYKELYAKYYGAQRIKIIILIRGKVHEIFMGRFHEAEWKIHMILRRNNDIIARNY